MGHRNAAAEPNDATRGCKIMAALWPQVVDAQMIAVRAQGLHVQTAVHPASADERLRLRKPKSVRVGHRLAGDLAVADIEAVAQMDVVPQSLAPTLVGKLQRKGQGGVVERKSRRARHRSRHVGDAIMHHPIDHKGRIGMGRRPRRFGTSALIDGDVDEHGALLHRLQHCASNEFGRGSPGHEHRADYEIGFSDEVSDRSARREDGAHAPIELGCVAPQNLERSIEERHLSAHAERNRRGVGAGDAAADDQHICRRSAGNAAQENTAPARLLFKRMGADLRREAPGDFRHRCEKRQSS